MSTVCANVTAEGIASYVFSSYHSAGRCVRLFSWAITHKNGTPLIDTQPDWATVTLLTPSIETVVVDGEITYRYVLNFRLDVEFEIAFDDFLNRYNFTYTLGREDCTGALKTCNTVLRTLNACAGLPNEIMLRVAFLSTAGDIWSGLLEDSILQNIGSYEIVGANPGRLGIDHELGKIITIERIAGNDSAFRRRNFDGSGVETLATDDKILTGTSVQVYDGFYGLFATTRKAIYSPRQSGSVTNWSSISFGFNDTAKGPDNTMFVVQDSVVQQRAANSDTVLLTTSQTANHSCAYDLSAGRLFVLRDLTGDVQELDPSNLTQVDRYNLATNDHNLVAAFDGFLYSMDATGRFLRKSAYGDTQTELVIDLETVQAGLRVDVSAEGTPITLA
jgi:hypothetical protein